GWFR
ncbi:hypothetical protein SCA6_009760, partial [Theobroma cacao]